MSDPTHKRIYAKAIGDLALDYLEMRFGELDLSLAESNAIKLISDMKAILDDEALNDPECFQRIEAIVECFHEAGLHTARHNWG